LSDSTGPCCQASPTARLDRVRRLADFELLMARGADMKRDELVADALQRLELDVIGSGPLKYARFEPGSEIAVRRGVEFAVLRYQAAIALAIASGPAGPRPPGIFWHTDVYQLHDRRWRVAFSQATLIRPQD
jgi:hypothetical protein